MSTAEAVTENSEFVNFWNEILVPKFIKYRHILVDGLTHHSAEIIPTLCATNTLTVTEVWSCMRDEGGPLGAGDQAQASNHRKLRRSRAGVVSVAEKAGHDPVR